MTSAVKTLYVFTNAGFWQIERNMKYRGVAIAFIAVSLYKHIREPMIA